MARGMRKTAFDQSSYDYWSGQYGVVNVKDFGAVGDGVHDDAQAIQAAVNATPLGGILVIPPGTFYLGSTVNVPNPISIVGAGSGSILIGPANPLINATNIGSGITGDTNYGLMIRDMQMQITSTNTALALSTPFIPGTMNPTVIVSHVHFNSINNGNQAATMTTVSGATGIIFEGCTWIGGEAYTWLVNGLLLEGAANCRFTNCEFTYLGTGITAQNTSGGQLTQGCYFVNCYANGCDYSVVTSGTLNIQMVGSMFDNSNNPISGDGDQEMTIANCYIGSNQVSNAINLKGSPGALLIQGCRIVLYNAGNTSIALYGTADTPTQANNICDNIFIGMQPAQAIALIYAAGTVVRGNIFETIGSSGTNISVITPAAYNFYFSNNINYNPKGARTPPASPLVSGTVYTNTYGVVITIYQPAYATTAGTAGTVTATVGSTTVYTEYVSGETTDTVPHLCTLRVPPSSTYSFTTSGTTLLDAIIDGE